MHVCRDFVRKYRGLRTCVFALVELILTCTSLPCHDIDNGILEFFLIIVFALCSPQEELIRSYWYLILDLSYTGYVSITRYHSFFLGGGGKPGGYSSM